MITMRLSRKWARIYLSLLAGGIAVFIVGALMPDKRVMFGGVGLGAVGAMVAYAKCKCPYCGVPLARYVRWGKSKPQFCPGCENEILYDDFKDTRRPG